MKASLYLSLALVFVLASCKISDNSNVFELSNLSNLKGASGMSYKTSLERWNELKQLNGNSYKYQTTFLSWTGYGSTTELTVEDGLVTGRIYQEFSPDEETGERVIVASYSEDYQSLGSHERGAAPWTIDELYDSCARDFLIADTENNTIYFETETNGMMTLCGFAPNDCEDDCYQGISIDSFEWIE